MFCTQPFNHIDVIVENDMMQIQPCNVWSGHRFTGGDYSEYIKPIQTKIKKNFSHGCKICKVDEALGSNSRRLSSNQLSKDQNFRTDKIFSVGLRYGTLCNAKCMICDHTRSTGWIKDAIKLGRDVEPQYLMDKTKMIDIKHVYQNFDLTDLKYVEFHGGEPLLHSYPEQFLKLFGNQSTVVKINTNGSILPNKDLIKELSKCKRVDILLSIDDIEDRFELLRYPLKWNKIMENLEWYKQQQYRIAVTPTISTLNIWYIEKFFKWLLINVGTDIYPQFVDFPSYLNIKHLNAGVKKILKEQLSFADKSLKAVTSRIDQDGQDHTTEMLNYVQKLDAIRNTNFPTVFKEWYDVIQDSLHRKS